MPCSRSVSRNAPPILLALFLLMRPPQTDSGPSAVTIDKFDPRGFQSMAQSQIVDGRQRRFTFGELGAAV
jgi:hypothetical protein